WCSYPFRQPILFWDGTVVGCEFDYDLEIPFGKVGKQGFKKIWNSRNALKLRRSINTKKGYPEFCNRCPFQDSIQNSCVISYIEYRPLDGVNTKQKIDAM
ncbi:SPASM domain-containing protein, partial [candidate division WOR-3 bacterium]|nr:SPASM domain-containing protein [candidate division WOR-3 bacterium]